MKILTAKETYERTKIIEKRKKEKLKNEIRHLSKRKEKRMMRDIMDSINYFSENNQEYYHLNTDRQFITENIGIKLLNLGYDLICYRDLNHNAALKISWAENAQGKIFFNKFTEEMQEISLNELLNIMYDD